MRRSTFVFLIFAALVAVIFGANSYFRNQPPITLTLAVDPLAEAWVRTAVERFNAQNVLLSNGTLKVVVRVESVVNDVSVWQERSNWSTSSHPTLWLASSSASLGYLTPNLPYQMVTPSTAQTPLMWGGFKSRVDIITQNNTLVLDWQAVQAVAQAQRWESLGAPSNWGNVNMGLNWGTNSMAGLAALTSALASYNGSPVISRPTIDSDAFRAWFLPIRESIQNSQRLGEPPSQAMASRGASVADFALLPEVQWLKHLNSLIRQESIVLSYPQYQVLLDFPLAMWDDANTTPNEREAAQAFANYLLGASSQQLAIDEGLRPVNGNPKDSDVLFATSIPYGARLTLDNLSLVAPFDRATADQILRLFN